MGIGSVNYWANEIKLFERQDGLDLILQELKKRNFENDNDVLESGRLAILAYDYLEKAPSKLVETDALLDYLDNLDLENLFKMKIKEFQEMKGPEAHWTFLDLKKWIAVKLDKADLLAASAYLRGLYRYLKNKAGRCGSQ